MDDENKRFKPLTLSDEGALPCALLSLVCLLVGSIHFVCSDYKADFVLVTLIVVGFAPWLGHVFESFGRDGLKYRNLQSWVIGAPKSVVDEAGAAPEGIHFRRPVPVPVTRPGDIVAGPSHQPASSPPPTPRIENVVFNPSFSTLMPPEKKVLATLWKYQQIHFPNPELGQWTFTVNPRVPDYAVFSMGLMGLRILGLAGVAQNGQAVLTREGVFYCQHQPEVSLWTDTYDNFSN